MAITQIELKVEVETISTNTYCRTSIDLISATTILMYGQEWRGLSTYNTCLILNLLSSSFNHISSRVATSVIVHCVTEIVYHVT